MPKLTAISYNSFVHKLKKCGFDGPYSGEKHPYMIKNDLVLTIPNPHNSDIGIPLLQRILKQAKISREEWLSS